MNSISKIIVIGDVMLDTTIDGKVNRISPEAPIPILSDISKDSTLGGAGNVCRNIRQLGDGVVLIATIGKDPEGKQIKLIAQKSKIDFITISGPTISTSKIRYCSKGQQICRVDQEDFYILSKELFNEHLYRLVNLISPKIIIFSDYAKGMINDISESLSNCKLKKIKTIVDPKSSNIKHYRGAYLITPNESEFRSFFDIDIEEDDFINLAIKLIKKNDISNILITLSEKGMMLINSDGSYKKFNAIQKDVYDVTGAGDTVVGTIAYYLNRGFPLDETCDFANIAASIAVSKKGTYAVKSYEINNHYKVSSLSKKIFNFYDRKKIKAALPNDQKIVFTNGCFDILHLGHIETIQFAKSNGDFLIIGINSDASVKKIKGDSHPIVTEFQRARIISALKDVDMVIIFNEPTPYDLINFIKPSVLVKGGDYLIQEIVGKDILDSYGGEVKIFDIKTDISSTKIKEKISQFNE